MGVVMEEAPIVTQADGSQETTFECWTCERPTTWRKRAEGPWFCTNCGTQATRPKDDSPVSQAQSAKEAPFCTACNRPTMFRDYGKGPLCTACSRYGTLRVAAPPRGTYQRAARRTYQNPGSAETSAPQSRGGVTFCTACNRQTVFRDYGKGLFCTACSRYGTLRAGVNSGGQQDSLAQWGLVTQGPEQSQGGYGQRVSQGSRGAMIAIIGVVVLVVIIAVGAGSQSKTTPDTSTSSTDSSALGTDATSVDVPTDVPLPALDPDVLEVSGSDNNQTDIFTTDGPFTISYDSSFIDSSLGSGLFSVEIHDSNNQELDLPFNTTTPSSDSTYEYVDCSEGCYLEVTALNVKWHISVQQ